jgi:MFS family permease
LYGCAGHGWPRDSRSFAASPGADHPLDGGNIVTAAGDPTGVSRPALTGQQAAASPGVVRARNAVYAVFAGHGFAYANWAARIPQVRDLLQASPGTLGLVLFAMALGSVSAPPLAGAVVTRLGAARSVALMALLACGGLGTVAIGIAHGTAPVAAGLFAFGFASGTWDVAMNVQGAAVEQQLGRPIMPRFHAGWSIGTVAGAGTGAVMVAAGVPVTAHLLAIAVLVAAAVPAASRGFLPQAARSARLAGAPRRDGSVAAWAEPRTLLIGLFVLCMAFTEGTGNDWLSLAVIGGYRVPAATGTVTFALFLAAMTSGRWFGPALISSRGRVPVLRASAAVALAGLLLVVFGHVLALAMLGAVILGLGTALGFPVGVSAAADDPRRAAGRVSVAASIGYLAFITGPPVIGFLGDRFGVLHALMITAVLLAVATAASAATAPLPVANRE